MAYNPSKYERAARFAGWRTADLTPNAAVNESMVYEDGSCAFFQAPAGYDLWENLCIAQNIEIPED
jgi:hypothetical protein